MAKPEWGTKRVCLNCGVRFYDMLRDPIICPSCATPFDPSANVKSRRGRAATKAVAEKETKEKVVNGEDEMETEVDLDEEDLEETLDEADAEDVEDKVDSDDDDDDDESGRAIEDVSELGDDDVSDVIDVDGEGEEETT